MASSTSRIEVERGRPPGYTGIKGSTRAHCSSVRSLGYRCVRIPTTYEKHPSRTASESEGYLARGQIPYFCGLIITGGGEAPTVRAERHTRDPVRVSSEGEGLPARGQIP